MPNKNAIGIKVG